jgi:hypothetical protein
MSELSFRLNGQYRDGMNELKEALNIARRNFTEYCSINNMYDEDGEKENWNFETAHKLEEKVKQAEYKLYYAEYEDNRKRNWR